MLLLILQALHGHRLHCQFGWVVWVFVSAVQLAPLCYLFLAAASRGLVTLILSNTTATYTSRFCDEALALWSDPFPSLTPPVDGRETVQREWDHLQAEATFDHLLNSAPNDGARARLLVVSCS